MHYQTKNYPVSIGVMTLIGSMISLCIGTSFAKSLFSEIGAQGTTFFRLFFSAVLLWLMWRPWRFEITRASIKPILFYGVSLAFMNFAFYMALCTIPMGIALAIEFCGPLGVALFSSRQKVDFLWIALAIIGLLFLIPNTMTGTAALDPIGIMFAIGAGVFWATYIIVGQWMRGVHPGQGSAFGVSIAALIIFPFAVNGVGLEALWRPDLLGTAFVVGLLSSAIPYSLEMVSLRSLEKKTFGILVSLEPAFGAMTAAIILHEYLSLQQILAILCIISASIGCSLTALRKKGTRKKKAKNT